MADLQKLANAAMRRRKLAASHVGMPQLVEDAIRGAGITNANDIKKLKPQVLSILGKRAATRNFSVNRPRRSRHRAGKVDAGQLDVGRYDLFNR